MPRLLPVWILEVIGAAPARPIVSAMRAEYHTCLYAMLRLGLLLVCSPEARSQPASNDSASALSASVAEFYATNQTAFMSNLSFWWRLERTNPELAKATAENNRLRQTLLEAN